MAKPSILHLIFGRRREADGTTLSIGEAMERHRDSLRAFEAAVQDLLDDNRAKEAEIKRLRGVSPARARPL